MKPFRYAFVLVFISLAFLAVDCALVRRPRGLQRTKSSVDRFLADWGQRYRELHSAAYHADWGLNTRIVEGDKTNSERFEAAQGALASFVGSAEVIEQARKHLARLGELTHLQKRQLEAILYRAANYPQTIPEVVDERIAAEAAQTEALFGFEFKIADTPVTTNDIDDILRDSTSEIERLAAWRASKEVGKGLKKGLARLVELRNASVRALDYDDFFHYQVAEYGLTTDEMMEVCQRFVRELRPLYRELHTWARHELASRFKAERVPDQIPAHWLPNRWGQSWRDLVQVEGLDLDGALKEQSGEWVIQQAEAFYVSLGFEQLPQTFWSDSSLYPLPPGTPYKKNNHASAWHMNLDHDVRCLMSLKPNADWWETTHHELGHIYYFLEYSHPGVPIVLREGANRGFHEAIGSLLGLASMQKAYLQDRKLVAADAETDEIRTLLREALDSVVFMPFAAGTMTHFERDLYADELPADEYNARWWAHVAKFQGITPPTPRGEEYCDAASKTHINNDAAQYYDYAISYVLLHQFHAHIAKEILEQEPRNTNYWGNKKAGEFLGEILRLGATRDWREVLRDTIGEDMSARAMLDYFAPLMDYLKEQNQGREATLEDV